MGVFIRWFKHPSNPQKCHTWVTGAAISDGYAARGEPRAVVAVDRLGQERGVLARRREAPRALVIGHRARDLGAHRVAGAIGGAALGEPRGPARCERADVGAR